MIFVVRPSSISLQQLAWGTTSTTTTSNKKHSSSIRTQAMPSQNKQITP
jgi:hypothetical protein